MPVRLMIVGILSLVGVAPADEDSDAVRLAMDEKVKRLRDAGHPTDPADLKTWPALPDDKNAAKVVAAASARLEKDRPLRPMERHRASEVVIPLPDEIRADVMRVVADSTEVLTDLNRLASLDGYDWGAAPVSPLVKKQEGSSARIWVGTVRSVLWLDGLAALEDQDVARAWRRSRALRHLADGAAQHPHAETAQYARNIHELAAKLAEYAAVASGFDEQACGGREECLSAIRYWLDDAPVRSLMVRAMHLERVAVIDTFRRISDGTLVPPGDLEGGIYYEANTLLRRRIGLPMWPTVVDLQSTVAAVVAAEGVISRSDSHRRQVEAVTMFAKRDAIARYLAGNLAPGYDEWHMSAIDLRAQQQLTAAALAVRLYRNDHHGALPPSLEALTPQYLTAVPSDPTSEPGEPQVIRYRPDDDDPLFWASGRNGKDDGGRPPTRAVSIHDRWKDADLIVPLRPPLPARRD